MLQNQCCKLISKSLLKPLIFRQFGGATSTRKKFYKNVSIVQSNGFYEINLDQRKLKTPGGSTFKVTNEPLAQTVALEWLSQGETLQVSQMHVTGLCNTAQDNPARLSKEGLVDQILGFLRTDTILYYAEEPPELLDLQVNKWSPVINWFRERYKVEIQPTTTISPPSVSDEDVLSIRKHLLSFSLPVLHGFSFGVDALKSLILTLAVMERIISVEKAVELARLELLHQTSQWGNVEWAHDIELHGTTSRLAAATLFVHMQSAQQSLRKKNIQA